MAVLVSIHPWSPRYIDLRLGLVHGRGIQLERDRFHTQLRKHVLDKVPVAGDQKVILGYASYFGGDPVLSFAQLMVEIILSEQVVHDIPAPIARR